MSSLIDLVVLLSALGCGLMAGFFFAFSICVMRTLGSLAPEHGIAAMQGINVAVINRWFLTPFLGTAVACLFLIVAALLQWNNPGAAYLLAGGLLYFIGTFLVTMIFNVPRNNALAAVAANSAQAAALWQNYLIVWTNWNHVRTVAALAATACLIWALTR